MPALKYRAKLPKPDDPALLVSIYEDIVAGIPMRYAAIRAGIAEDTAYHWRMEGNHALEQLEAADEDISTVPQAVFAQTVKEAEAECVASNVHSWMDPATGKDWVKHATILERRYGSDFGKNQQVTIESHVTVLTAQLPQLAEAELLKLLSDKLASGRKLLT